MLKYNYIIYFSMQVQHDMREVEEFITPSLWI